MSMLILCTGKPLSPLEGSYTSAAFDEAAAAVIRSAAEAPSERRISPGGRDVYIGEGLLARSTAEQILEPCELHVEPLLNEIGVRSFSDSDRPLPAEKWLRKAAAPSAPCGKVASESCRPAQGRRFPPAGVPGGRRHPRRHADPEAGRGRRRLPPDHLSDFSGRTSRSVPRTQLCRAARRPFPVPAAGEDRRLPEGRTLRRLPAQLLSLQPRLRRRPRQGHAPEGLMCCPPLG